MQCFAEDLSASTTARLTGISRRTCNTLCRRLRERLAAQCRVEAPIGGTVELDESYFGPRHIPGKRGRGAGQKTIVFGILERGGKVYTQIVTDTSQRTLRRAIRDSLSREAIIHSNGLSGYDGLVDMGYARHLRVQHGRGEYANSPSHINGIESFWSYAKRRLAKFNGVPRHTFYLHLKETEFRFNHRHADLYQVLLTMLRHEPL